MWIDGKCINIKRLYSGGKNIAQNEDTDIKDSIDLEKNDKGRLFTSFQLPSHYYWNLLTFHKFKINALRDKTQTDIFIPSDGKNKKITINGDSEENISKALDVIYSFVGEIRNNLKPLQFLCIPLLDEGIQNSFTRFKDEILSDGKIHGVDESIFISPLKVHLTVAVFALLDDREVTQTVEALKEYKETILKKFLHKAPRPLKIKVAGLECMRNNYKKCNVLYAKATLVDENEDVNLQKILNDISDFLQEKGLVIQYKPSVKIHMTIMNVKYRNGRKYQPFDATEIMHRFKNYEFGICSFKNFSLCLMSSSSSGQTNGFYETIASIEL